MMEKELNDIQSTAFRESRKQNFWYFQKISEIMSTRHSSDNSE